MGFINFIADGIADHPVVMMADRLVGKDGDLTKLVERAPGVGNAIAAVHEAKRAKD
ncbi:hypothetical protein FRB90_000603 [Tulasnella sp. 427]|nr:hypothetical protein FRB90_000603 [Tulasnella sp. 427]